MNFLNEFVLLLKARYPIIYISTTEEERIEYLIRYCTKKYVARTYYAWDFVEGYQGNPNDIGFAARNPLEALDLTEKLTPETAAIFILKDYDNFFKDFSIIRKLKNLSKTLKTQPKNIIIISSELNIPDSLKEIVTTMTSAAARHECRGAHTVYDYERPSDDAEFPLGRNDKEWMKHTLWHSADNSLSYKPVNLKPLTVDSVPPKVRTF